METDRSAWLRFGDKTLGAAPRPLDPFTATYRIGNGAEGNAGPRMAWYIVKAHAALIANFGRLWRQRRAIRSRARITPAIFRHLMRGHGMSARRVAEL